MAIETLHDLYVDELKDLYSAENQILKALPRLIKAANSDELRTALEAHAKVTEKHAQRLEKIVGNLGEKPTGKKCVGMEGVLEEGKELFKHEVEPDVMDAGIIGACQKVEHYEIASYGTARAHAKQLGHREAASVLMQTLNEEKQADDTLTKIAESAVNAMAVN